MAGQLPDAGLASGGVRGCHVDVMSLGGSLALRCGCRRGVLRAGALGPEGLLHVMRSRTCLFLGCLLLLCSCRTLSQSKLQIVMEARGVDEASIRLWLDGRFIGAYSAEHSVFQVPPGEHTIRAVGHVQDTSEDDGSPTLTPPFEQKILILGGDNLQTLVVTLSPPSGTR